MPKTSKYPRLRTKVYRGASGQGYVYYVYDMRPERKPDIRLGKDFPAAVAQWDQLHNHRPRTIGRLQEAFDKFRAEKLPTYTNPDTRTSYARHLKWLEKVFGQMAWGEVTLPMLERYLTLRPAKFQGNREMGVLSVVWGRAKRWGMHNVPWPAAGTKGWKNPEPPREMLVTDEMFTAVYAQGDQVLRDCMDIATATGMRLTDARTIRMPVDGILSVKANKTGKAMQFAVADSPVLSALVERREKMKAYSVMLLSTHRGRQVTAQMLQLRWARARELAATKAAKTGNAGLAEAIRAMYLRDMRKRAAVLAGSLAEASKLLQHEKQSTTRAHYFQGPEKLRAVR